MACRGTGSTDGTHVSVQVADNTSDGNWDSTSVSLLSPKFGNIDDTTAFVPKNAFFTFVLNVPQGATVNQAILTPISKTNNSTATVNVFVDCCKVADATPPTTLDATALSDGTSFPRTTDYTDWLAVADGTAGVGLTSPDIRCPVQEILDQTGWSSGNHILVFVEDALSDDNAFRLVDDFNDSTDGATAATLDVWYSTPIVFTPSGGLIADGTASPSITYTVTPAGGLIADGSASPTVGYTFTPAGGLVADGSSGGLIDYVITPTGGAIVGPAAWSNGYQHRLAITVPSGAVAEDIDKFYLGVTTTIDTATVLNDGTDFYVTDSTGSALDFALRDWDGTTGRFHLFVKTPLLSASDNVLYIYTGKPS